MRCAGLGSLVCSSAPGPSKWKYSDRWITPTGAVQDAPSGEEFCGADGRGRTMFAPAAFVMRPPADQAFTKSAVALVWPTFMVTKVSASG